MYAAAGASPDAVREFVTCPDGPGTGTCDVSAVERIRVENVKSPGIQMSGIDLHLSTRLPLGASVVAMGIDGTSVRDFLVKALDLNGAEIFEAQDAAGKLNWNNPIAPPLPRWRARYSTGFHVGDYSFVSYVNFVSGYTNEVFVDTEFEEIDRFVTRDLSILRRTVGAADIGLSVLNLLDSDPPLVNWEQSDDGFSHNPKGRRIKLSLTYRPGG